MKRFTVHTSLVIALTSSLVACIGVQNIKSDYQLAPSSDKGLVVGTLTLARSTYSAPVYHFQGADGKLKDSIAFSEDIVSRRPRTDLPDRLSKLFIFELASGKYNLYELRFPRGVPLGYAWIDLSSTSNQNISFDVEAGKATYVGDLLIDTQSSVIKGILVNGKKVRDLFDQDKEVFMKTYPGLAGMDVKRSLFRIGSSN